MKRRAAVTSKTKALLAAKAAQDKKAEDVLALDMRGVSNFTDYFVIASGTSDRQVKAIADGITEALGKRDVAVWHREGYQEASWVVLDCADVIVHIFHNNARQFYALERLWADAPRVAMK